MSLNHFTPTSFIAFLEDWNFLKMKNNMNRSSYYGIEDFAVVTFVALVMVNIKVPKEVCFWLFKANQEPGAFKGIILGV